MYEYRYCMYVRSAVAGDASKMARFQGAEPEPLVGSITCKCEALRSVNEDEQVGLMWIRGADSKERRSI